MEFSNQNVTQEHQSNNVDNHVSIKSPNLESQIPFRFMNSSHLNASQLLPHFGLHRVNAPQPYDLSNQDMSNVFGSSSQGFTTAPTTSKPVSKPKKKDHSSNQKKPTSQQAYRCNWSTEEDVALTRAFLYVTTDPIVGNEQSGGTMWERILEAYKNNVKDYDNRGWNSLKCHWKTIQGCVSKFHGFYEGLERAPPSGTTTSDMKREAKFLYEGIEGSPFKFDHCWEIMKESPKWCSLQLNKTSSKKAKVKENSSVAAQANEEEKNYAGGLGAEYDNDDDRPVGRKSSKENKKRMLDQKAVVDVLCSFQTTIEKQHSANQQSLELRERMLSKELELKEKSHKLKEEAAKRKEKAEKRREQERIMNTDLNTLQPILRTAYVKMQDQIMKEWGQEGLFGDGVEK